MKIVWPHNMICTGIFNERMEIWLVRIEMSEALDKIAKFRYDILRDLLSQCTEEQIEVFNRMYVSIDRIEDDQIDWAIQQCERTIEGNNGN